MERNLKFVEDYSGQGLEALNHIGGKNTEYQILKRGEKMIFKWKGNNI